MKLHWVVLSLLISCWITPILADDWESKRMEMVRQDLAGRDIRDFEVLRVMGTVPRHLFVPKDLQSIAYADRPLPIGEGQTISQPYIVALMTQLLKIKPGMKVLEIGTGSGYQAAVLAALDATVYSIEIREKLASRVKRFFQKNNIAVMVKNADGYHGWKEHAPFDRIIITAAANHIPRPLLNQLKPGGKLIVPLGSTRFYQTLTLVHMDAQRKASVEYHGSVRFVPMVGKAQN